MQDYFDYYGMMVEYEFVKVCLFGWLGLCVVVINCDDVVGVCLLQNVCVDVEIIEYGIDGEVVVQYGVK